jgi:glycosyltransferase involved in cell wall biosynthesis
MTVSRPRVSIGIPVFNGEPFLRETLDSLLAQTYSDFELVISDNASTDGTETICRDYARRDGRIRYYRSEENCGAAKNYRRVFDLSSAPYFKWANADDVSEPGHVARCVLELDRDATVVLACSKTRFIDATGQRLDIDDPGWNLRHEEGLERLRYALFAGHWVNSIYGVMRRHALAMTRFIGSYPGGDYRVLTDLTVFGKFVEVPEYLFLRRLHPGASSHHVRNVSWLMAFYTGQPTRIALPTWQRAWDDFVAIHRSGLSVTAKLSLLRSLMHRSYWHRTDFCSELIYASKHCLRRLNSVTSPLANR